MAPLSGDQLQYTLPSERGASQPDVLCVESKADHELCGGCCASAEALAAATPRCAVFPILLLPYPVSSLPRFRPIKNQAAWKPVLGRLRLLDLLLPRLGVSKSGGGDSGFSPEPLMGFVSAALANANAEVRRDSGLVS